MEEDSVFDPISDIQPSPSPYTPSGTATGEPHTTLSSRPGPEQIHAQGNDESDSALDTDSVSGVAESPAESSYMQPGSQPSSYSLSTDLMSRLKLDQPIADRPEGPGTPDSMVAMGSVPSTTLSDLSAVGAPGGSNLGASAQKEGSGNRRPRHQGRSSFGSSRYLCSHAHSAGIAGLS